MLTGLLLPKSKKKTNSRWPIQISYIMLNLAKRKNIHLCAFDGVFCGDSIQLSRVNGYKTENYYHFPLRQANKIHKFTYSDWFKRQNETNPLVSVKITTQFSHVNHKLVFSLK